MSEFKFQSEQEIISSREILEARKDLVNFFRILCDPNKKISTEIKTIKNTFNHIKTFLPEDLRGSDIFLQEFFGLIINTAADRLVLPFTAKEGVEKVKKFIDENEDDFNAIIDSNETSEARIGKVKIVDKKALENIIEKRASTVEFYDFLLELERYIGETKTILSEKSSNNIKAARKGAHILWKYTAIAVMFVLGVKNFDTVKSGTIGSYDFVVDAFDGDTDNSISVGVSGSDNSPNNKINKKYQKNTAQWSNSDKYDKNTEKEALDSLTTKQKKGLVKFIAKEMSYGIPKRYKNNGRLGFDAEEIELPRDFETDFGTRSDTLTGEFQVSEEKVLNFYNKYKKEVDKVSN